MPAQISDIDLLARLVAFDSTSRNSNLPIADFLCDYLERPGIRVRRNLSSAGDKANLIVVAGPPLDPGERGAPATLANPAHPTTSAAGAPGGARIHRPGLVLSGHMDVVPAEEAGWQSAPFTLADRGDRLVGRGACDMKGFLALAANLTIEAAARPLARPLALLFTFDEEVGTLGAKWLVESCPEALALPSSAVIGEPTGLRVVRAHKGHLTMRITLHGRSAHSGYPHLGQSAIEPAAEVVTALAALRRELAAEATAHAELFPEVPFVPLNIGRVHGGAAINVVPDRCVIELGMRRLPGGDARQLAARVERIVHDVAAACQPEVQVLTDSPPLLAAEEAPVVRQLLALAGQKEAATVSYATDAGWLQQLGMDCVLFGPGSIDVAHRPNEHVPKADLAAARQVVAQAIAAFCAET